MAGVREVYRKLQKAQESLPAIAEDAIDDTKGRWLELNKDQMLHGEDSRGEMFGKYKSPQYASMKNKINPLPGLGNKDYRLTGDYYKGMFLTVESGKIMQSSVDEKAKWLEREGDKRYGLQPKNKEAYASALRPVFNQLFLQKLK